MQVTLTPQAEMLLREALTRKPGRSAEQILDEALTREVASAPAEPGSHLQSSPVSLVQENGLLVHTGKAPCGFDWDRIVDAEREERFREVIGR